MPFSYVTQLFTGGMNKDIDPAAIDLSMKDQVVDTVADSQNMVFERGLIQSRLGLSAIPGPPSNLPSNANLRAVKWLPFAPHSLKSQFYAKGAFAVTDAPKLYSLNGSIGTGNILTPTEITGPGFTQSSGYYCDHTLANGVVLLAGNSAGLVRWDPVATVYTILAASPYQYVAGHLARAVAAYDLGLGSTGYAQTVAWSVQGDETKWNPATDIGAGKAVLTDVSDSITGLKVAKGVVVVARAYGFHLGIPTGQFPAVYDWRKVDDISVGCMHPASLTVYKNTLFFMSECGVHMYDMVDVTDIGEGIYTEINTLIRQYGLIARGFISTGYKPDFQPSYNIVLDSSQSLTGTPEGLIPHYMYNLREKKWSRHFYVNAAHTSAWTPLLLGAEYVPNGPVDQAAVPFTAVYQRVTGAAPVLQQWNLAQTLDTAASFTTGLLTLKDPTADCQLERIMLVYNCAASAGITLTATVTYILNGTPGSTSKTFTTYAAGGWDRRWFNLRVTGNQMSIKITFPIGTPAPVKCKALILEYSDVGGVRT